MEDVFKVRESKSMTGSKRHHDNSPKRESENNSKNEKENQNPDNYDLNNQPLKKIKGNSSEASEKSSNSQTSHNLNSSFSVRSKFSNFGLKSRQASSSEPEYVKMIKDEQQNLLNMIKSEKNSASSRHSPVTSAANIDSKYEKLPSESIKKEVFPNIKISQNISNQNESALSDSQDDICKVIDTIFGSISNALENLEYKDANFYTNLNQQLFSLNSIIGKVNQLEIENLVYLYDLGSGSQAKVQRYWDKKTQKSYALKIYKEDYRKERALKELKIIFELIKCQNDKILKFYHISFENNKLKLLMEYGLGDLKSFLEFIEKNENFQNLGLKVFIRDQITDQYNVFRKLGIVHRDIKPENIILTEDFKLKYSDFGLSEFFDPKGVYHLCGTQHYTRSDLRSRGCISGIDLRLNEEFAVNQILQKDLKFPRLNENSYEYDQKAIIKEFKNAQMHKIFRDIDVYHLLKITNDGNFVNEIHPALTSLLKNISEMEIDFSICDLFIKICIWARKFKIVDHNLLLPLLERCNKFLSDFDENLNGNLPLKLKIDYYSIRGSLLYDKRDKACLEIFELALDIYNQNQKNEELDDIAYINIIKEMSRAHSKFDIHMTSLASENLAEAQKICLERNKGSHILYVEILILQSKLHKISGSFDKALRNLEEAKSIAITILSENHSLMAKIYSSQASIYKNQNDFASAEDYYRISYKIKKNWYANDDHPQVFKTYEKAHKMGLKNYELKKAKILANSGLSDSY